MTTAGSGDVEDPFCVDDLGWLARALCAQDDPPLPLDAWFPDPGTGFPNEAIAVCERCPVQARCLAHRLALGTTHGWQAGIGPTEAARLASRRVSLADH